MDRDPNRDGLQPFADLPIRIDSTNTLPNAMIINGDVIGNSVSNRITFNGYVKGLGTFQNVTMNGTFAPGLSPTISYVNDVGLGANAILDMEIGGLTAGTQFDKLVDAGNLSLNGTLKVTLIDFFNPMLGQSFDLLDWSSLSGTFSSFDFSQASLGAGLMWDTSQLYVNGNITITAIPEPAAILMVSIVAMTFSPRRRRPLNRS